MLMRDSGRLRAALVVSLALHGVLFLGGHQVLSRGWFSRFTRELPPPSHPPLVLNIHPPAALVPTPVFSPPQPAPHRPKPRPENVRPRAPVVAKAPAMPAPAPAEPKREPTPTPAPVPPPLAPVTEPAPATIAAAPTPLATESEPEPALTSLAPTPEPALNYSTLTTTQALPTAIAPSGLPAVYVPPRYRRTPAPLYPEEAKRQNLEGEALLEVSLNERGQVQGATLRLTSGHPVLDEAALAAVRRWRFYPARLGEVPVASTAQVPVAFSMKR